MAEGGEVSGNEADFYIKKCSPCLKKGTEKGAEKYCFACKLFLCANCIEQHNGFFSEHRLVKTGGEDIDVALTLHRDPCPQHGKSMHLYCKVDKAIGCEICMASEHGSCSEVAFLPTVASSLLKDIDITDIKTKIKETIQRLESFEGTQQTTMANFEADRDKCLQEIDKHHEELSTLLAKVVKSSKDKVLQTFERYHTELQRDHQNIKQGLADLQTSNEQLERKKGKDVELLLEIDKQKKLKQSSEEVLIKSRKNPQVAGFDVVDQRLNNLLSELESLVSVLIRRAPVKMRKHSRIDISSNDDQESSNIWGSCVLPDGSVVLADVNNNVIKRVDQRSLQLIDQCSMKCSPYDVCCVDKDTVAVTGSDNKVTFMSVNPRLSITRSIQMYHRCVYLTCSRGELFINNEIKILYVYNMNGTHLRKITTDGLRQNLFSAIRRMTVSDDGDRLYVTDEHKGVIILDKEGNILDTFMEKDKISRISSVCLDSFGGWFVTGWSSNNVVQVGPDGKIIAEVLTSSDGLKNPSTVCVDRVRNRMFVSQYRSNELHVCEFEAYDRAMISKINGISTLNAFLKNTVIQLTAVWRKY